VTLHEAQTPLRILMIAACPFPWPRGTPIRIQRLAQALVEEGNTVDVFTYHLGKADDELPFKVFRTAKVFYYNRVRAGPSVSKLLVLDPMLVYKLLKIGKTGAYDIIHAHHVEGVMTALAARASGLKLPIVYDAHTLVGSELLDYGPAVGAGIKRWLGNYLDHACARRADSVIAVTDAIKQVFVKRNSQPANRVYVIPNGVENDFMESAAKARMEEATGLAVENSAAEKRTPLFLFAGNMAAYQGIDLMLKAFARVVQHIPGARLEILSNEPFADYQALADSLGIADRLSITALQFDKLPAMLVQADVLLNPRTRCAGIPQKLLNYMAAGRPVVSFAGSARIISDRVDGLVVEDGDVPAFADAMLELVANTGLGKTLAAAGLKSIQAQYSWRGAARKTLAVYRDTLTKNIRK